MRRQPIFEFVPMGSVLSPSPGAIALDVGNRCERGVIDHHFRDVEERCAASLVVAHPDYVLDHLEGWPDATYRVILHNEPDLDCLIAAYLTVKLVADGRLPVGAPAIADYALRVDSGRPLIDGLGETSLWGLFAAMASLDSEEERRPSPVERYTKRVERGFRLLDAIVAMGPQGEEAVAVRPDLAGWAKERALLRKDILAYQADKVSAVVTDLGLPSPGGGTKVVRAMYVEKPSSLMFKHFARAEGFCFTHVATSWDLNASADAFDRHIIAVAPGYDVWLKGLGAALEREELRVRAEQGKVRRGVPRWPDVANNDPWYDGRSPIHGYTIVDSPRCGTLIPCDDVRAITERVGDWRRLGEMMPGRVCPKGCRFPPVPHIAFCPEHGEPTVPVLVAGRYEVVKSLGSGAMGDVYRVYDLAANHQECALKVIKRAYQSNPENVARFMVEAETTNRAEHPGVVTLLDVNTDADVGLFLVTELVKGHSLESELEPLHATDRQYPEERALTIVDQLFDALAAVHEHGVLHRDMKPENILLETVAGGRLVTDVKTRIIDFGVARLKDPEARRLTRLGWSGPGSPLYMSPEAHLGLADRDAGSDLYSVGLIWYEMLTNLLPFEDPANPSLNHVKVREYKDVPPVAREGLRYPKALKLLAALVSRKPGRRPASARSAREELRSIWP